MKTAFILMTVLAAALGLVAYQRDPQMPVAAMKSGGLLLVKLLPVLVVAFFVAGLMEVLVPRNLLVQWVGTESGFRGLLVGAGLGAITPGGPFVQFPIVASMYKAGAGIGPLVAYLSAWALIGLNRLVAFEIPLLGPRIALIRLACSLTFPVVIGYLASLMSMRY